MKVSIIIPSYNDSGTLKETLLSIKNQNYNNWEVVLVDDGSTDDTKNVFYDFIKKYNLEEKMTYFYQKNCDQLNAILNGLNYVKGEYIIILHSDDILYNDNVLNQCVKDINSYDAIIGNIATMDKNSQDKKTLIIPKYLKKDKTLALQTLWLGRNLYCDTGFFKKQFFETHVKEQYLIWNMPFWFKNKSMSHVKKVNYSLIKYRIFEENYINSELGNLNVLNGEIRTLINLLKYYNIPFYKIQFYLYRLLHKIGLPYYPFYNNKTDKKNIYKTILFAINKRLGVHCEDYIYYRSLLNFYKNEVKRTITLKIPEDCKIYFGKDIRIFNKKMLNNDLEQFYINFMNEMINGFNKIKIEQKNLDKLENILKFFCIYNKVKIEII